MYIDAIMVHGWKSWDFAEKYQRLGLMVNLGNQMGAEFKWLRFKLETLSEDQLKDIYKELKGE